jgi:hypothetical protein
MVTNPEREILWDNFNFTSTEKLQGVVCPVGKPQILSTIPSKIAVFVVECSLPRE